jgi:hypothetical protein
VSATGEVGTVSRGPTSFDLTGVYAAGQVGDIVAIYWKLVDDSQTANWQNIDDSQTGSWVLVDNSETAGWVVVDTT